MTSPLREVPGTGQGAFAFAQRGEVLNTWMSRPVRDLTTDIRGRAALLSVLVLGNDATSRTDEVFLSFISRGRYLTGYDAAIAYERAVQQQPSTSRVGDVGYFPAAVREGVPAREVPGSRRLY